MTQLDMLEGPRPGELTPGQAVRHEAHRAAVDVARRCEVDIYRFVAHENGYYHYTRANASTVYRPQRKYKQSHGELWVVHGVALPGLPGRRMSGGVAVQSCESFLAWYRATGCRLMIRSFVLKSQRTCPCVGGSGTHGWDLRDTLNCSEFWEARGRLSLSVRIERAELARRAPKVLEVAEEIRAPRVAADLKRVNARCARCSGTGGFGVAPVKCPGCIDAGECPEHGTPKAWPC